MLTSEQLDFEKKHLNEVYSEVLRETDNIKEQIKYVENLLKEQYEYKEEDYYSMDSEETTSTDLYFQNLIMSIEVLKKRLQNLENIKKSAYFGSFKFSGEQGFNNVYVGTNGFVGRGSFPLVCDWRAPISALYYDYELGEAKYLSPSGEIKGEILDKRQYKVNENEIVYALSSSLVVADEILKKELATKKSDKMTNIVATIQKEQNKIIRDQNFTNMLIQGVAGSGKTSIALHRAAYLLYSMRDKIKSENILVISPSKMFSKYIENVLPELGENSIKSIQILDLAHLNLKNYIYEDNFDVQNKLADKDYLERYRYLQEAEFVKSLNEFLLDNERSLFKGKDIVLGEDKFEAEKIEELYFDKFKNLRPNERLENICDYVCDILNINEKAADRVLNLLYKMYNFNDVYDIFIKFINNQAKLKKKTEKIIQNGKIYVREEEIPTILYLKNYFFGLDKMDNTKLLIVDEFQELPDITFQLLKEICPCVWLILGDINQSVYRKFDENFLNDFANRYNLGNVKFLNKSYRMTNEISDFAMKVKNVKYENFDRPGEKIDFKKANNLKEDLLKEVKNQPYETIAVIVKDGQTAEDLYELLKDDIKCNLNKFEEGSVLITNYSSVKGIEFEKVIVADATKQNYVTDVDKNILYNIVTRATNKLVLLTD